MKSARLWLLIGVAFASGLGLFAFTTINSELAPEVVFKTTDGNKIVMSQLRGSPVLVNFWASDCPSCLREMPALDEIYRRFSGRGLKMIGVAMHYDIPSRVMELVRTGQITYPVAFDLGTELALAFGKVEAVPNSFLIAPDGRIVFHKLGLPDIALLETQIEQLLRED